MPHDEPQSLADRGRDALGTRIPLPISIRDRFRGPGWKARVAHAALPPAIATLITTVVRRTRLWPGERADVASELIAHFQDGLDSGHSPEHLIANFGDPAQSAKLIRASKKRNRPWVWRAMRRTFQGVGVLLLILVGYVVWFTTGTPTISRNFTAELNAKALAAPETDRAWSQYKQAILALPDEPESISTRNANVNMYQGQPWDWTTARPDHPQWSVVVQYMTDAAPALDLARKAGSKPSLGFRLSNRVDDDLYANSFRRSGTSVDKHPQPPEDPNPELIGVLLPHLGNFRSLARHLGIDAHVAATQGDSARVVSNLRAMRDLSRHADETPFLISRLVSVAIDALASNTIAQILERSPDLLSRSQLIELAHIISVKHFDSIDDALAVERNFFLDVLQRTFTDDGHGNGRLTTAGFKYLVAAGDGSSIDLSETNHAAPALSPVLGAGSNIILASRQEQLRHYDAILSAAKRDWQVPFWTYDGLSSETMSLIDSSGATFTRFRYLPVNILMPALGKAFVTIKQTHYTREATLTVLAIHAFRADTKVWPERLDQLIPQYLPTLPLDMFDGRPLRYRLENGAPLLYSIGNNRTDEQGQSVKHNQQAARWIAPSSMKIPGGEPVADGDLIYFPPSKATLPKPVPQ